MLTINDEEENIAASIESLPALPVILGNTLKQGNTPMPRFICCVP